VNPLVAERPLKLSGLPPKLVMTTGCVEVVPAFWVKLRVVGLKLMADGRGPGGSGTGVTPKM